ncbi:MAG TPA: SDR family NAD(P)-dependent oxidoreductase [Polyangiales bacterium]|nr:SDR family NAD(P)-dependent oxidoreductase [Polyangiales bacterium]
MRELKGKTALVTGASRGIGRHLAHALADRGMNLVLAARSAADLDEVKAALQSSGVRVLCVPTDVSDSAALEALVAAAIKEFDAIALLINNAGLEQGALYSDYPRESVQRIIDVNLSAPMLLTHMLLPQMIARREGHVVNIASVAGLVGVAYNEAYSATKHAMLGFTRSLAATAEGEGWPIGFSCILPGFVSSTGMYEDMKQQSGVAAPLLSGVSSPEQVVAATLRAVERDRLEVVVSPSPFRVLAIFLLLFPSATKWALRWTGSIAWFKAVANARRHRRQASDRPQS